VAADAHTGPILAIAGGSGLAPIKSIVETALDNGHRQPIHLYVGVRDERDLYLEAHFAALAARHRNLRFVPVLSQPHASARRRTGFVHEAVLTDIGDVDGAKAYIAGPPVMVERRRGSSCAAHAPAGHPCGRLLHRGGKAGAERGAVI